MILFIVYGELQFNSTYYALTEISSIPLHLAWMIMFLEEHKKGRGQVLFKLLGFSTVILYFIVRILGGILQILLLFHYRDRIRLLPWLPISFVVGGNLAITTVNVIWFKKLMQIALGKNKVE